MKKNLQGSIEEFDDFFMEEPDVESKAWGILHDFYHYLLTWMEDNQISKAELARKLCKSRASITKMFRHNPNVSIKKMVEITHPLGLDIKLGFEQIPASLADIKSECETQYVFININDSQMNWITPQPEIPKDFDFFQVSPIIFNKVGNYD